MPRAPAVTLLLLVAFVARAAAQISETDELAEASRLARAGKLEEARAAYGKILTATPQSYDARTGRARVTGWLGRYAEALSDYDSLLLEIPDDGDVRIARARVLSWMGRHSQAETELRRVLAVYPKYAEAYSALGDVLGRQGRYAEAAGAYVRARSLAPKDPQPVVGLARVRSWRADLAGARAAYETALRLDPENAEAKEGLRRLEAPSSPPMFRLDLTYLYDDLSGPRADWHQQGAYLTVRPQVGTTVFASVDRYRRFGEEDAQVGLGGAHRLPGGFTISAAYTRGLDVTVVARQLIDFELSHRLARWATPLLRYRRSSFPGDVRSDLLSPGLELSLGHHVSVLGRYYYDRSSAAGNGHAAYGLLTLFPEGRLTVHAGAAVGRESFLAGTAEQAAAATDVTALSGTASWRMTDRSGVRLGYAYEDRHGSYVKHGLTASLFFER